MRTRLKRLRIKLGLTQDDVSKLLGIKQNAYSYIESGKTSLTDRNAQILSEKIGVDKEWLLSGVSTTPKDVREVFKGIDLPLTSAENYDLDLIDERYLDLIKHFWEKERCGLISNKLKSYPDLNLDWLITGKGEMLKTKQPSPVDESISISGNNDISGIVAGGSNNVNVAVPSGAKKIIRPDKTVEIEMTSQQEDVSSLKNEIELLKMRVAELEDIIARQNRVIDRLIL